MLAFMLLDAAGQRGYLVPPEAAHIFKLSNETPIDLPTESPTEPPAELPTEKPTWLPTGLPFAFDRWPSFTASLIFG
ncbi:hypothetical protein BX661DRAFT_190336 [Kickxella alabastrina]|uniref:uncharacterized protein n=1 Tax=Kickxella alabastrina TaxID=61397 RepID=UPI00221E4579|nr:uncharacterized protein BX661DRAFT_190336 [Kickxella alabastrina]KAI7819459.1 hypothetical protein BX661DRAFT_190336 [Kickxella alabastrina]